MALQDPTGGIGFQFGEVLSHVDMTTIATQQPDAFDLTSSNTALGTTSFSDKATFEGGLVLNSATGTLQWRLDTSTLVNANSDITIASDNFVTDTSSLAGNIAYEFKNTPAPLSGMPIRVTIRLNLNTFTLRINNNAGAQIADITSAAAVREWIDVMHNGTDWIVVASSSNIVVV